MLEKRLRFQGTNRGNVGIITRLSIQGFKVKGFTRSTAEFGLEGNTTYSKDLHRSEDVLHFPPRALREGISKSIFRDVVNIWR